jgi:endonuclease/exonuclease/phosphatase family metal-dependent hydrolase
MNKTILLTAFLALCGLAAQAEAADPKAVQPTAGPGLIRIMTFNIRYGTANDGPNHWDHRKDLVVGVFRKHEPDIVGVQEALRFQTDYIREKLPRYQEIGVGREDGLKRGEYVPIFYDASKLYAGQMGTFWLSETPEIPGSTHWGNGIPRICTWARFTIKATNTSFYVYNVHLDHVSQPSREKGVRLIVERMARRAHPDPIVLTGDMNAHPDNPAIRYLLGPRQASQQPGADDTSGPVFRDTWRQLHPDAEYQATFNAWKGDVQGRPIDYIMVMRDAPSVEILESTILHDNDQGRYPSDHYPVLAALRFPRTETRPAGR